MFCMLPIIKIYVSKLSILRFFSNVCLGLDLMFCSTTNCAPRLCISVCSTTLYDTRLKAGYWVFESYLEVFGYYFGLSTGICLKIPIIQSFLFLKP